MKNLFLYEEAPECYKDVEQVVADLEAAGLIDRIACLRPLVTFKTGERTRIEGRRDRKARDMERSSARSAKAGRMWS